MGFLVRGLCPVEFGPVCIKREIADGNTGNGAREKLGCEGAGGSSRGTDATHFGETSSVPHRCISLP